jgi:hypothetical protein
MGISACCTSPTEENKNKLHLGTTDRKKKLITDPTSLRMNKEQKLENEAIRNLDFLTVQ